MGGGWTQKKFNNMLKPMDRKMSERAALEHNDHATRELLGTAIAGLRARLARQQEKPHRSVTRLYGALFRTVFRPNFRTSIMRRKKRRISAQVSRRMGCLRFYDLRKRLERNARLTGMRIHTVNESWTSKICGACSHYHAGLGRSKLFVCPKCRNTEERGMSSENDLTRTHTLSTHTHTPSTHTHTLRTH